MQKIIYTNPAMAEAFATLKRLSMDPEISGAAAMREKAIKDYNTNMRASYREGRVEGEAKGRVEIIKNMFCAGASISDIARFTGLSIAEIEKIKSESD